ncbi:MULTISPECIES: hypothetical protein [unclassified Halorhabdus]|uniref:hypothetical protein n=1 Tax=unclassified Halorhabdus TaxID=2621901 RepID=UPI0023DB89D0|nr:MULTISPECIES: hypothetical protein [unclassified Halorhabdus]WEL16855.1 Uncharacterized protein SVXHr_0676 [Halorhabdus sp. SVX81]WEL20729.1 Uncharacterized protein HBNXHr_0656 [Halorhabdus sp. BNX81]
MARAFDPLFGDPVSLSQQLLIGVVIVTLVFSGPLVPGLSFGGSGPPATIGDGNATVSTVAVDADAVQITPGRFGTAVSYLRIPDAKLSIDAVEGEPRIVYRLVVPKLDVDHAETRLLAGPGDITVRLDDVAFVPGQLSADRYDGALSVRVQSLSTDRTVFNESVTIEVEQ